MALVKRIQGKTKSSYIFKSKEQSFLFDFPGEIYGKNISFPAFGKPSKPLKIAVPKFADSIDYIMVTRSDSLGVLFLKYDIHIYITEPVYDQILLEYEKIKNMIVHYDEEDIHCVDISEINIERFKKNAHFVHFGEECIFNDVVMAAQPSGTFIGWANYLLTLEDGKTLFYVTSLSHKTRFSTPPVYKKADYAIINQDSYIPEKNQITEFSSHIQNIKSKIGIIPVNMTTLFLEIIVHILFLMQKNENVTIYIISSIFNKLNINVNLQNAWLNEELSSLKEPFPLKIYKKLVIIDDFSEITNIYTPALLICDTLHLQLFKSNIFSNQEIIAVNNIEINADFHFSIKLEAKAEEILKEYCEKIICSLDNDKYMYLETLEPNIYFKVNGKQFYVHKNVLFLDGRFKYSDKHSYLKKRLTFVHEESYVCKLFKNSRFCCINNEYYFPNEKLFVNLNDEKIIIKKNHIKDETEQPDKPIN